MKALRLDEALINEKPEIIIGDKVYKVDNRTSTVKKIMAISRQPGEDELVMVAECLKLALGEEKAAEVEALELPFRAYMKLFELVLTAATGEEVDLKTDRVQNR